MTYQHLLTRKDCYLADKFSNELQCLNIKKISHYKWGHDMATLKQAMEL